LDKLINDIVLAKHSITLENTALHWITQHYIGEHSITLENTALHWITQHYIG